MSTKIAAWALTGSGAAALGWAAYRLNERAKLAAQLGSTVRIQALQKGYVADGKAPEGFAWIMDGAWETKAAEALPLFSTLSVDEAYEEIKNGLPRAATSQGAGSTIDVIRKQLKSLGIDVPDQVDDVIDILDEARKLAQGAGITGGGVKPRPS
jgi:hypothetical protein